MNKLKPEMQDTIIGALVEGSSIRSVERMTGVHRDTIMRLMIRVGNSCGSLLDHMMHDLPCNRIEVDEVWCYVGKKERHVRDYDDPNQFGHFWTWVALDPETKLIPSYLVGKRNAENAHAFICDLSERLRNRVQLSSDRLRFYIEAVEAGFGGDVDYGQIVKSYEAEPIGPGRYSPPKVTSVEKRFMVGNPNIDLITTSYVERSNLTLRMHQRRFTRLTNAFSKKAENLRAAVGLHFAWYNLVHKHSTIRTAPAVAAGVIDHPWTISQLVELAESN